MSVTKKIEKKDPSVDATKYIMGGSEVRSDITEKKRRGLCIYIPTDFLREIDLILKRRIGISRNAWILEAMQQKMEQEKRELKNE